MHTTLLFLLDMAVGPPTPCYTVPPLFVFRFSHEPDEVPEKRLAAASAYFRKNQGVLAQRQ